MRIGFRGSDIIAAQARPETRLWSPRCCYSNGLEPWAGELARMNAPRCYQAPAPCSRSLGVGLRGALRHDVGVHRRWFVVQSLLRSRCGTPCHRSQAAGAGHRRGDGATNVVRGRPRFCASPPVLRHGKGSAACALAQQTGEETRQYGNECRPRMDQTAGPAHLSFHRAAEGRPPDDGRRPGTGGLEGFQRCADHYPGR